MSLFSGLRKVSKTLLGSNLGNKASNVGELYTKGLTYGFSKGDKYSLLGQYSAGLDAKKAAEEKAKLQEQTQLDLLNAQETAAANALQDLSMKNTPNVIAGGTADTLLGLKKRKASGAVSTIATQLGLS